ncbi:hypothetical protein [Streptomyces lydicus]|uniref:hypothetical protein n=1 Tax=Streptomyces lydicus TaxID=47763 RepID=UPI00379E8306
MLGVGKGVDRARGQCTRQVVQRDEGRVEADVLRLQCIGCLWRPLPQELVDEGVFMVGVFAQLLRHGQAAFRLASGGAGAGDVRGTQFDGKGEQARTLPHVNIPVKVDLGHGLSSVWSLRI